MDPLQVNLRWLVALILFVVIVPTVVVTGIGIAVIVLREEALDLVFGILVSAFAASVIAGAVLLMVLARRGARLARVQETFLSHMGHQLMTPLAGIRLHGQILSGIDLPRDASASVEAIQQEAARLQRLVERILSWRRVRTSGHLYKRERTTIGAIVDRVVGGLGEPVELRVFVRDADFGLDADEEAVAEALTNLLLNATKYAADGGPIDLVARRFASLAVFSVRDRGPGLPEGQIDRLFEPFFRFIRPDEPDPGGTGLGLSIARQIALAHGGKLSAGTRHKGGAAFTMLLPLEERRA